MAVGRFRFEIQIRPKVAWSRQVGVDLGMGVGLDLGKAVGGDLGKAVGVG